jgi:hypothetical protein
MVNVVSVVSRCVLQNPRCLVVRHGAILLQMKAIKENLKFHS